MTQLVFIPRKLVHIWLKRGWGLVDPDAMKEEVSNKNWAVLMHPPGWMDDVIGKEEKKDG